jgi:uncharacterized protein (DUF433 family)
MTKHERIESNPNVMFGKPVIKGTRITVEQILRKLGGGMTPQDILRDHPRLTLDDIRAAEAFAADYLADEEIAFG